MRALAVTIGMLVAACGDDQHDEKPATPCDQLREHLIDLRLADAIHVDQTAHRDVLRDSLGENFLASCATLSDDTISCALAAADASSAAACDRTVAR